MGSAIRFQFDDQGARAATKALRRDINRDARQARRAIARELLEPHARAAAPSIYQRQVQGFATGQNAGVRIGGAGEKKRIAGYLEFGGTIRGKHGGFLVFQVDGRWVRTRVVHRARSRDGHYVGRVMTDRGLIIRTQDRMRDEVARVLDRHLARSGARVG